MIMAVAAVAALVSPAAERGRSLSPAGVFFALGAGGAMLRRRPRKGARAGDFFRTVFEESPAGIAFFDAAGTFVQGNRAYCAMVGADSPRALADANLFRDPRIPGDVKARLAAGETVRFEEATEAGRDRRSKTVLEVLARPLSAGPSGEGGYLVQALDITARRRDEEKIRGQQRFLENIIESLGNPFYVVDVRDGTIRLANSAARKLSLSTCVTCHELAHGRSEPCEHSAAHPCPLHEVQKTRRPVVVEHLHYDPAGTLRTYEVHGHPVFDEDGRVVQMIEYSMDISERKRMEDGLRSLSLLDELTGLYNRRGFRMLATKQLATAKRLGKKALVVFFDLDGMKAVNDTFGHREGDGALIDAANLIRSVFRESDIIARVGGDEFVACCLQNLEGIDGSVARRIDERVAEHNATASRRYRLSLSTGMAFFDPAAPASLNELLDRADRSMYEEKMRKKGMLPTQK